MSDDAHLPPPLPLIADMGWCWWTRPRATRIGDVIYFGAIDCNGGIVAATYDLKAGVPSSRQVLAAFEADDHNNPALFAVPGRPLICFYSRHDAEEGLRYRISTRPLDLADWQPEQSLTFGGSTTYAQVHQVGETLHLFTRVNETRWGWCQSGDWAKSWDAPRDFLSFDTDQQVYMATALLEDGHTLRVAVSGHPKEYEKKPLHDVWACVVDLATGVVSAPGAGGTLGNLFSGAGLPLDYTDLELVHRTPADRTANLLDVSRGPEFEIAFTSKIKDDLTTRDARYHVSTLHGGRWQTDDLVAAGRKFGYIDAGFYVGGMAFPDGGASGRVYLTREEAGLWHLDLWQREADGRWSGADLVRPGPTRLARPWAVSPPTSAVGVVALALERYDDDSYYGSLSHLVGAPETRS